MKKNLLINLILLSFLFSCATRIEYRSDNKIPVYLSPMSAHPVKFEMEEKLDFYMFGQYPEVYKIPLDELASKNGFTSISGLRIFEYLNVGDLILSVLSFGLYTPRRIVIQGLAKQ